MVFCHVKRGRGRPRRTHGERGNIKWSIRCRSNFRFWEDGWLDDGICMMDKYQCLYCILEQRQQFIYQMGPLVDGTWAKRWRYWWLAVTWAIWKLRNRILFSNAEFNASRLFDEIKRTPITHWNHSLFRCYSFSLRCFLYTVTEDGHASDSTGCTRFPVISIFMFGKKYVQCFQKCQESSFSKTPSRKRKNPIWWQAVTCSSFQIVNCFSFLVFVFMNKKIIHFLIITYHI